jgi:hypothetical protein
MDRKMLEALRNLAPKRGDGISSITLSAIVDGKEKSVVLTAGDRERMNRMLKLQPSGNRSQRTIGKRKPQNC